MITDPFAIFSDWYQEAQRGALVDPTIVALATASKDARPSVRMVLYRGFIEGGFSFFTNYESRKGNELSENPFAAMVFYWAHLGKQIRIEGEVSRLSSQESDAYFRQRRFHSRVTAVISRQSRPLLDESDFLNRLHDLEQSSAEDSIERPKEWGGFKLIPSRYEFWTHREHRRHDRMLFEKHATAWKQSRLFP